MHIYIYISKMLIYHFQYSFHCIDIVLQLYFFYQSIMPHSRICTWYATKRNSKNTYPGSPHDSFAPLPPRWRRRTGHRPAQAGSTVSCPGRMTHTHMKLYAHHKQLQARTGDTFSSSFNRCVYYLHIYIYIHISFSSSFLDLLIYTSLYIYTYIDKYITAYIYIHLLNRLQRLSTSNSIQRSSRKRDSCL